MNFGVLLDDDFTATYVALLRAVRLGGRIRGRANFSGLLDEDCSSRQSDRGVGVVAERTESICRVHLPATVDADVPMSL